MDFPLAERPVNHNVKPCCLRSAARSAWEREACHVMLLNNRKNLDSGTGRCGGDDGRRRDYLTLPFLVVALWSSGTG